MTTRLAAVVIGIVFASAAPAVEVAGVKLDDKVKIAPNAPELVLNGAGVRTRVIVKVYVGALYLPEKKTTATEVLALPGAKRITLAYDDKATLWEKMKRLGIQGPRSLHS